MVEVEAVQAHVNCVGGANATATEAREVEAQGAELSAEEAV